MTIRSTTFAALWAACAALAACQGEPQKQGDPAGDDRPVDAAPPAAAQGALSLSIEDLRQDDDGKVRGRVALSGDRDVRTVAFRLAIEGGTLVEWTRDDAFLKSGGGQVLQAAGDARDASLELAVATTKPASLNDEAATLATFVVAPTADVVQASLVVDGDRGVIDADGTRSSPAVRGAAIEGVRR